MGKATSKPNGPLLRKRLSPRARLFAVLPSVAFASCLLAGCGTIPMTATTTKAQCAAWRAITYSSSKDTAPTVEQIRVHNQVGQKLGCWK